VLKKDLSFLSEVGFLLRHTEIYKYFNTRDFF
jgi:hypothetical protein